jgi:hypothetical protein
MWNTYVVVVECMHIRCSRYFLIMIIFYGFTDEGFYPSPLGANCRSYVQAHN